jgi:hypothetical protein
MEAVRMLNEADLRTLVDELCYSIEELKAKEDAIKAQRKKNEDKLLSVLTDLNALDNDKTEGTENYQSDYYQLKITKKLKRAIDPDVDVSLLHLFTKQGQPQIDIRRLRDLATSDPDRYRQVLRYIVTSPASTAVAVTRK